MLHPDIVQRIANSLLPTTPVPHQHSPPLTHLHSSQTSRHRSQRVINERHRAIQRAESAIISRRTPHRNTRVRQQIALQLRRRRNARARPDLEKHITGLRAVDQCHVRPHGRAEGRGDLKNPLPQGICAAVQRQRPGQRGAGGRKGVDARGEGQSAEVGAGERLGGHFTFGIIVGRKAGGFGVAGRGAGGGSGARALAGWKAGDGGAGAGAAVAGDNGEAGAGESGAGDGAEGSGEAHDDWDGAFLDSVGGDEGEKREEREEGTNA